MSEDCTTPMRSIELSSHGRDRGVQRDDHDRDARQAIRRARATTFHAPSASSTTNMRLAEQIAPAQHDERGRRFGLREPEHARDQQRREIGQPRIHPRPQLHAPHRAAEDDEEDRDHDRGGDLRGGAPAPEQQFHGIGAIVRAHVDFKRVAPVPGGYRLSVIGCLGSLARAVRHGELTTDN